MSGKYRLHHEIHAVISIDGKPPIKSLPVGSVITVSVLKQNAHIGMIEASWGDRLVKLFAEDSAAGRAHRRLKPSEPKGRSSLERATSLHSF